MNKVIFVPYADIKGASYGLNTNKGERPREIYFKNVCVSLFSAKYYNPDADVALVTNIDLPEEYDSFLRLNSVKIIKAPFEKFKFDDQYPWCLAFYKLCALEFMVRNTKYDFFSYIDSDVYVQANFNGIWKECKYSALLYDLNNGFCEDFYEEFISTINDFTGKDENITHYGGEFFAANRANAEFFADKCEKIFEQLIDEKIIMTYGDEFIVTIAASQMKERIKNSGSYVFRCFIKPFSGVKMYYPVNNSLTVLHLPFQKETGMIKLYDRYIKKGKLPKRKTLYKILKISHSPFKASLDELVILPEKIYKKTKMVLKGLLLKKGN